MSRRNAFVVLLALGLVVVIAITFLVPHRSDRTRAAASVARPPTPDASVAPAEPALAVPPELVAPTLDVERAEPRVAASEPNAFAPPSIDEAAAFLRRVLPDRYGKLTREEAAALTALDLRGAQITDADLALLAGLPALAIVSLRGTAVTDAGLVHLRGLANLTSVDLRGTQITGGGFRDLPAGRLEELHLTDTRVRGEDMLFMPTMPRLRVLKLNGLTVGDAALADLPALASLEHLELDGTQVTADGVKKLLGSYPTLRRIELRRTPLTAADVAAIQEQVPGIDLVLDWPIANASGR